MKIKIYLNSFIVVCLFLVIAQFGTLEAVAETKTNLKLSSDKEKYLDPNYFFVDIAIDSASLPINAVSLSLNFSTSTLGLHEIIYEQSFCSFFIFENIDNLHGTLNIACASETPFSSTSIHVARLVFDKKMLGWSKFIFSDDSLVLSHDGFGSNLLESAEIHSMYIVK